MKDFLAQAYDPAEFRRQGHAVVDLLADYLESLYGNSYSSESPPKPPSREKVLNYVSPEDLYAKWEQDLSSPPTGDLLPFLKIMMHDTIRLHHPKYMGHQRCVVAPPVALAEFVGSLLDPGMGVFEHGTTGVVLERLMAKKIGGLLGWKEHSCEGFFVHGGTLGNLTALLCARQVMIPDDVWQNGYQHGKKFAFLVSSEAHYSVARATKVMGMGDSGSIKVPVDEYFRLRTDLLEEYFQKATSEGVTVIGVVSSSCSTATGSHDDIEAIAKFCQAKKLWLHVDGAHGGAAIFSARHRHRLRGVEHADSFSVDFHKMLLTSTLTTATVFRNGDHSYETFAQKASYLWEQDEGREWYNLGKRTLELTKTFASIRVYALWRTYGTAIFEQNVDRLYALGTQFNELVDTDPDFQTLLSEPETNVVCFQYRPRNATLSEKETEHLNSAIREEVVKEGQFSIVQTRVHGNLYLRCSLMNPFTTEREMVELLEHIRTIGQKLNKPV